jgi:hypothetical protein
MLLSHPLYLAPLPFYASLYSDRVLVIDGNAPFTKQTYRNRAVIATENGTQSLTIPVVHDGGRMAMRDVRISEHGNWRRQHWNALVSAYRKSPFFDYYADDFAHFYEEKDGFLMDFNIRQHNVICELLGLQHTLTITDEKVSFSTEAVEDIRHIAEPERVTEICNIKTIPYYQVFMQRHGFIPNLSIADLLFNMGPEGLIILDEMVK